MRRPEPSEYHEFYAGYVSKVPETEVVSVLESQVDEIRRLAAAVPADRESYRYAPGKWSVRQIFGHLSDTERLFGYRAACIARGDRTPLPGIEQDEYVEAARFDEIPLAELADELIHLRLANLPTFRRLEPGDWSRQGTASGFPITVRALAYILAGHIRHHVALFDERYGIRA